MKPALRITALIDRFYFPPFSNMMPLQTFRYAVCGAVNQGFDLTLYAVLYNFVLDKEGVVQLPFVAISSYIAAWMIVFPITFLTGFWLNRHVAFRYSPLQGRVQFFRYMLSVGGSILLTYLLLKLFVEVTGFYPTPSRAITMLIVICYSYLIQKYFTFRGCENT